MVDKSKWLLRIIFVAGFLICCYPLISGVIEGHYQSNAIKTYSSSVDTSEKDKLGSYLQEAEDYNSMLYQTKGAYIGDVSSEILSKDNYNRLLNLSGNGVMGSVEIPKINVNLPIYHGTDDSALSNGVGHVEESSLPVGGENTRSVLTGHRGLPNSKLFTRLDEIDNGDLFFVRVLDKTLAYRVFDIQVIKPEEVDKLDVIPEKDTVTLLTCTPYGLNTHRLIVTGERVDYVKEEHESIKSSMMSWREILFAGLPFVFVGTLVVLKVKDRKERRKDEVKKN